MAEGPLLGPRRTKDEKKINWVGSSIHLKKNLDLIKVFNFRMQIIGLVLCLVMSVILLRLYSIQIVHNNAYQSKLDIYTSRSQTVTTPRGTMVDCNGQVLVGNRQLLNITYFPVKGIKSSEEKALAKAFSQQFSIDESILTKRDLKDLFISQCVNSCRAKITDEERSTLNSDEQYKLKLNRISDDELNTLSIEDRKAWVVTQAMTLPSSGQTKVIKSDVSIEEIAYLTEHSQQFKGFSYEIGWEREYPFDDLLKGVLGNVSTSKQGLPADKLNYYLASDYVRNEKIGRSGLESQYEDLLSGTRSVYDIAYDDLTGLSVLTEVKEGSKGYDLKLTLDANFQIKVEQIIKDVMLKNLDNPNRKYMKDIYFVASNPKNGDILAIAGMKNRDGVIYNDPISAYTDAFEPGSSVKGATLYMGLTEGVISPGEMIYDAPITIKGTPSKSSWRDLGLIDDLTALSQSSNVYMFNVAMRLGKANYTPNAPLNIDTNAFNLMRSYYSQFGLGIITGIDAPSEAPGYVGRKTDAGYLLDLAIGQYDTYTAMQLSQYINTIANNGKRVQPRFVTGAYDSSTAYKVYQNDVDILSTVDDFSSLSRVQQGFRKCVVGGLCASMQNNVPVEVAAKTGTAESFTNQVDELGNAVKVPAQNAILVAYAPYNDPEISIACAAPFARNDTKQPNICAEISNAVLQAYYQR